MARLDVMIAVSFVIMALIAIVALIIFVLNPGTLLALIALKIFWVTGFFVILVFTLKLAREKRNKK